MEETQETPRRNSTKLIHILSPTQKDEAKIKGEYPFH